MAKHAEAFERLGVTILGVSADTPEESADLKADLALPFHLLHDNGLAAATSYGVAMTGQDIAVPSVFIVGTDQVVQYSYTGTSMADRPTVRDLVQAASNLYQPR